MTLHMARPRATSVPIFTGRGESAGVAGGDGDALAAVVAGLGHVVVPVDVGVNGVRVPDQGQVGEEPVVHGGDGVEDAPGKVEAGAEVLELGVAVRARRPQGGGEEAGAASARLRRPEVDYRLRAFFLDGIEHGVGDLGQGLVPGASLPLAPAAL